MVGLRILTHAGSTIAFTKLEEPQLAALAIEVVGNRLKAGLQQGRPQDIQLCTEVVNHFDSRLQLLVIEVGAVRNGIGQDLIETLPHQPAGYGGFPSCLRRIVLD